MSKILEEVEETERIYMKETSSSIPCPDLLTLRQEIPSRMPLKELSLQPLEDKEGPIFNSLEAVAFPSLDARGQIGFAEIQNAS
ncbi:Hypothetical protein FKW44_016572 [Caligus rogercresseyi]|uniref:Uncharacterized protein n=1 Tax=Caligus rogercresseyi TaxID=217165 RepID=A0A7T8H1Y7_CALRO|nr:Hypothetical protein FKW44_016572 [Caligus rogercresseyi]